MNQLTQEEAERAAKCCGWERKTGEHEYQWAPGHSGYIQAWWEKDGEWRGVDPHPDFLDPLFWFGRLWKRLDGFRGKIIPHQFEKPDSGVKVGGFTITMPNCYEQCAVSVWGSAELEEIDWDGGMISGINEHPCLAFCEAIESLTGEGK